MSELGNDCILDKIVIANISKKYKKMILQNLSFSLEKGDIVGLVGPNGAGKSSLLRIISGVNNPSSGHVNKSRESISISTIFDFNGLYMQLTAYENLKLFYNINGLKTNENEMIDSVLSEMKLSEYKNIKAKNFSKGMLRKLAVARIILSNPDFLLLDEPFDGLDIESHKFIIEFLRTWAEDKSRGILVSSHNMSDIENLCNKIIVLNEGLMVKESKLSDLYDQLYENTIIRFSKDYDKTTIENYMKKCNYQYKYVSKNEIHVFIEAENISDLISYLCSNGFYISEIVKNRKSLEEVYLEIVKNK